MAANHRSRNTDFPCTDAGNAEFFADMYTDSLRFDHGRGRWMIRREHWWEEDRTDRVVQLAKGAARERYDGARRIGDADDRKAAMRWARRSESKSRLDATLSLAESLPSLSTRGDEWDRNLMLLGVANGVINLRTGRLLKGDPSDLISLHTGVPYDPAALCPRWEQFVREVFGGDEEMTAYIQRALGYSMTGDTREQVFFCCYGTGANGKSTLLELLRHVLGDYGYNLPFSALELKARAGVPNDIAALVGRRFVTAVETSESAELNEARIKSLTGGDLITARRLYQEFFTFVPEAKFWLAFNHRPKVADDSHGFWRRVRLVPFGQCFAGDKVDPELISKLRAEAPGILAWLVRGCLAWQEHGLGMPSQVKMATDEYRKESDTVGEFIDDRCVVEPRAQVRAGALYGEFCEWCRDNGERFPSLNRKNFTARLTAKGFSKVRMGHDRTWTWLGLRLRSLQDSDPPLPPANEFLMRTDADVNLPFVENVLEGINR
jgi:putative DNA primase/helicase